MIDLQLLGGLDFVGPDPSTSVRSRRRHPMMLLALVAAAAPKAIGRDRIMAFLWPESDSERASNSLRQALHCLRRDLGEDLFLPESASGIRLDRTQVSVDLWVFREAIARKAPGEAVAAYRGPFLDGFQIAGVPEFSRWLETERERVERDYMDALEALAREAESAKRHDEAVAWRRQQAAADPFSSRVALSLLKALAAAGDRPGALEYAGIYEGLIRAHLDAEPDPAFQEFVASLRHAPAARDGPRQNPRSTETTSASATPAVSSSADETTSTKARGSGRRFMSGRERTILIIGAVGLVVLGAIGAKMLNAPPAERVIVLSSGAAQSDGRDTATRLIACEGPMCPGGSLPQYAYIVPTHLFHARPATGTRYIAAKADGTSLPAPGYPCCSTAVFENAFALPGDAVSATIYISLLADNQARVSINGIELGRQADSLDSGNHGGPSSVFARRFQPHAIGVNRLRVTLWDGGGAAALNYRATVTWETER